MSTTKKYLKSKSVCKVTFKLAGDATKEAKKANLVGEFNDWNTSKTKMRKLKNGSFTVTVDLETGKDYQFRYLVDGENWENDESADAYVGNGVSWDENSVVTV